MELVERRFGARELEGVTGGFLERLVIATRCRLEEHAANQGWYLQQLACTFLGAVVGRSRAIFVQIGDGAFVWRGTTSKAFQPVLWPQTGYRTNGTYFLRDDSYQERLRSAVVDAPVQQLAAFTDGLERLVLDFDSGGVRGPFLQPLFQQLQESGRPSPAESLQEFLTSPAINAQTRDDKTLILAARKGLPKGIHQRIFLRGSSPRRSTREAIHASR